MKTLSRKCPSCSKAVTYKSLQYFNRIVGTDKVCRRCARKARSGNKVLTRFSGLHYAHTDGTVVKNMSVKEFANMAHIPLGNVYNHLIHNQATVNGWSVVKKTLPVAQRFTI